MEELRVRHRKEQKDLQSRITQKKKNATKRTRKGVNDECQVLQRELDERHKAELATLTPEAPVEEFEQLEVSGKVGAGDQEHQEHQEHLGMEKRSRAQQPLAEETAATPVHANTQVLDTGKKPNRQKARLARRAAEQEALAAAAAQEAGSLPDRREQEMKAMQAQMDQRGLQEIGIRPDGHCMYAAVAQGLGPTHAQDAALGVEPYKTIRARAAQFIADHPDDFAPFLEEPLDTYVHKVKDTAEWGGELELQAIARAYRVTIRVLQADGRIETIGPGRDPHDAPIWLAYYRHSYGLGEHYNALRPCS